MKKLSLTLFILFAFVITKAQNSDTTVQTITGYKYLTEIEAQQAVLACDSFYGYPKPNVTTQHWCTYNYSEMDGFWYIIYDISLEKNLGKPEDFPVTIINNAGE